MKSRCVLHDGCCAWFVAHLLHRGSDWVLQKKETQRRRGRKVRPDTKYTARKRKDKF